MKHITVGSWEFELPDDWHPRPDSGDIPYLEKVDGTRGCYIKAFTFGRPATRIDDKLAELQQAQEQILRADCRYQWQVVDYAVRAQQGTLQSSRDFYDAASSHRILSVVVADSHQALWLTLHDYACGNLSASRAAFEPIVSSVRGPASGALTSGCT